MVNALVIKQCQTLAFHLKTYLSEDYLLVVGAGGVTVWAAMKTLSAKAKIVELPFH